MPDRNPQKIQSQAQKFNPRKIEPMSSASPPLTETSTSSQPETSTPPSAAYEKLTKQERKAQKKELKRERKEEAQQGEAASPSPSATP